MIDFYTLWCEWHGCDHGHCPKDCEHPQPVMLSDGRLVCGRCLYVDGVVTSMVPCDPEVC